MDRMDKTDALQVVKFLCWKAGVKEPSRVTWSRTRYRGHYSPGTVGGKYPRGRITIPTGSLGEWIVLHEVAHHVCAMRSPRLSRKERRLHRGLRGRGVWHGPVFTETVAEMATHWHGDPARYNWKAEYACVRRAFEARE